MTAAYTPTDAIPADLATLQLPENGELLTLDNLIKSPTSTNGPIAKLIDGVYHLSRHLTATVLAEVHAWTGAQTFDNITVTAGNNYKVSSRAETRVIPLLWEPISGFADSAGIHTDAGVGGITVARFRLPHGAVLDEFHLYIDPADGHAGLPGTMPSWALGRYDVSTGAFGGVTSKTDTSASAGAYDAYHAISKTAIAHTIDASGYLYAVTLTGESGANDEALLVVEKFAKVVITRTTIGAD